MTLFRMVLLLAMLALACGPREDNREQELVSRLQSSSELATVEMVFSKVVRGKKTSTILGIPTGTSDFLAETEARVKAGIDLSKVQVESLDWDKKTVILRLPPPSIISLSIPAEAMKVNEEATQNNYFSSLSSEDMDQFYRQADAELRQEVARMNLEGLVKEKTEGFLRRFLQEAGFAQISFQYGKPNSEP